MIDIYPKTAAGLGAAYLAGIPFFWSTLARNVFFSLVLFKTYEWVKVKNLEVATVS